jgi:ribosomal protein S12 methylthiotransferase
MPTQMQARGHADAPDIDCMVRVKGKGLQAGDIVPVKITVADGYDLVGRAVGVVR